MDTVSELISKFPEKRILVIGDIIIDQYIYGTATGLSAETPTVVAKELETKTSLGGAFLLVRNLLELGALVTFMSVVGEQDAYQATNLEHPNFVGKFQFSKGKRTTAKKRYWVDGYKLLQLDILDGPGLDSESTFRGDLNRSLQKGHSELVVVSDYRHGLLTPSLVSSILTACTFHEVPVYVDSQISRKTYSESNYEWYKGADVFCMNLREAQFTDPEFTDIGPFSKLVAKLQSENIVVKLGSEGCLSRIKDGIYSSDGFKVPTVDTCGAGDAFLAALCLCDLENSPAESLRIANAWAALSTTIHGTEPPKKEQLLELLEAK